MSEGMIGPTWLAAVFGILMIAAAVYAVGRIIAAWRTREGTDYEVDGHHVLMGISMAGMLIPGFGIVTPGPSTTIWIVVWILVTVWFAYSICRGAAARTSPHRFTGHHVPHLVMSAAMVYMLAAPTGIRSASGLSGMSAMGSASLVPWPTLDALFLVFLAWYAVLVLDRYPLLGITGVSDLAGTGILDTPTVEAPGAPRVVILDPRGAGVENVAMAVAMGYMLTMMLV